jgi:hypothetical protein
VISSRALVGQLRLASEAKRLSWPLGWGWGTVPGRAWGSGHANSSRRLQFPSLIRARCRSFFLRASVVLVLGFLVFLTSALQTFVIFGMLLATTISVALVADFILMPALMLTFQPFGPERARMKNERHLGRISEGN